MGFKFLCQSVIRALFNLLVVVFCAVYNVSVDFKFFGISYSKKASFNEPTERNDCGSSQTVLTFQTKLYSFKFNCKMVSLTAAKTKRMFSVSVAQVKCE